MNPLLDMRILGWILVGVGACQLVPLAVALAVGERALPLAASITTAFVFGFSIVAASKPTSARLRLRDSFLVVSFAWLLASLFGALPYYLGDFLGPMDALFEATAGFTTTGSTVMTDIEGAPHSLLLWRAITQWLGGMGIIVFAIAIVPLLGIGGMQLLQAELPGPTVDRLRPRIAETARRLLAVYVAFTLIETIALVLAGMGAFDAVCHALTTLSTGGFSTRDASVGAFGSPAVEWIIIFFMTCGGINFALHYRIVAGQPGSALRDAELHYFLGVIAISTLVVAWLVGSSQPAAEGTLRTALFQVVSIVTTTGYGTADFEAWPALAGVILLQLMILGGMAGSTSGGVKGLRVLLGLSVLRNTVSRMLHPHMIPRVKYGDQPVPMDVLAGIWSFFTAYFLIAAAATAVVAGAGYDVLTAVSAALTALGNVGPGLGAAGPTETFAPFPASVKATLVVCMIAGRLELFTILVLFRRSFWRL